MRRQRKIPPYRVVFFFPLVPLHSPLTCAYRVNAASAVNWLVSFRRRWRMKEGDEQEETRSNAKRSKRACDYVSDRGVTGYIAKSTNKTFRNYTKESCLRRQRKIPPGRVVFFFSLAPLHTPRTCEHQIQPHGCCVVVNFLSLAAAVNLAVYSLRYSSFP